jgi:choline dehydrogenase-like flavoprotein
MVATGVELLDGRRLTAQLGVIFCCGALRTPKVLTLSGIGPTEELEQIGVRQLANSADVGRNIWDRCSTVQH